ncbi:MAG: hypothetical protein AAGJ52_10665, partial [Pseudomonadota bacterium]
MAKILRLLRFIGMLALFLALLIGAPAWWFEVLDEPRVVVVFFCDLLLFLGAGGGVGWGGKKT